MNNALHDPVEMSATDEVEPMECARPNRRAKTVWIDLENSPNVPFFKPIVTELQRRGYSVHLTARDCFQVCELADLLGLNSEAIGRHYGKARIMKLLGLGVRALQLVPFATRNRPALSISHGSRSQLLASTLLRIPNLQIVDYEFTKAWVLIRPTWVMTPSVIPAHAIHSDRKRILQYPGIKEDVYVPFFRPNGNIRIQLGLSPTEILVCIRPPATEAHYHRPETDALFSAAINYLSSFRDTRLLVLPRNSFQAQSLRSEFGDLYTRKKLLVLDHVVDGLNLIWDSDLVVSAGGTMNREAAALGVPVYSVFRGEIGAVDRYLAETGRLVLLQSANDFPARLRVTKRDLNAEQNSARKDTLKAIVDHIERLLVST